MHILDRPWTALVLSCLAPVAFFYSNNSNAYSISSVIAGMTTAVVLGLICYGVMSFVGRLFQKGAGRRDITERRVQILRAGGYAVSICFCLLFFSHLSWRSAVPHGLGRSLFVVGFFVLLFFLIYKTSFRILCYILILSTFISIGTIAKNEIADVINPYSLTEENWGKMRFGDTLSRKPNIYLFFLESFHSRSYLNERFGSDMPFFFDFLKEQSFRIHENYISNYTSTVPSASGLLDMRHHYGTSAFGRMDAFRSQREALPKNRAFRFLKKAGYTVNIFDAGAYLFRTRSTFIDYTNFKPLDSLMVQVLDAYCNMQRLIRRLSQSFRDRHLTGWDPAKDFSAEFEDVILDRSPAFTFTHFGALHTSTSDVNDWASKTEKFRRHYLEVYEDSAMVLTELLKNIVARDPDSVIILVGDHGSNSLLGMQILAYLPTNKISSRLAEFGLTPEMVCRDMTSVIMAIRWPDSMDEPLYPEKGLSHVNLLPYVFSALNGISFCPEDYEPNDAYFFSVKILENSVPLETWQEGQKR